MDPLIEDVFPLNMGIFPLRLLMEEIRLTSWESGSLSYYHVLYISGGDRRISEPSTVWPGNKLPCWNMYPPGNGHISKKKIKENHRIKSALGREDVIFSRRVPIPGTQMTQLFWVEKALWFQPIWFQPIWKICASQIGSCHPNFRDENKKVLNHHLDIPLIYWEVFTMIFFTSPTASTWIGTPPPNDNE